MDKNDGRAKRQTRFQLNIYVHPDLVPRLDRKAHNLGLSRSAFVGMKLEEICADDDAMPCGNGPLNTDEIAEGRCSECRRRGI